MVGDNTEIELYVEAVEDENEPCDGCGRVAKVGELMLYGIESCCGGGCTRTLCSKCVAWAFKEFEKESTDKEV